MFKNVTFDITVSYYHLSLEEGDANKEVVVVVVGQFRHLEQKGL